MPRPADYGSHIDVIGNVFPPLPPPALQPTAPGVAPAGGGGGGCGGGASEPGPASPPPLQLDAYDAPPELVAWLNAAGADGQPDLPIFVGFGSMVPRELFHGNPRGIENNKKIKTVAVYSF